MHPIQLVVFDIAGTTVADKGNVGTSFKTAFQQNELQIPDEAVNKVMGWRKIDAIRMLLSKYYSSAADDELLIQKIHDDFTTSMIHFYENDAQLQPLPFAVATFEQLRAANIGVALNTGFTKRITDTILSKLNWQADFANMVISSDEVPEGRPHPYMINVLMQRCNITNPPAVAKVGDTEADILEGRNSGCGLVVGVTTGAYSREALAVFAPDIIIDSLEELPSIIKQH